MTKTKLYVLALSPIDLNTRYAIARKLQIMSKYERMTRMAKKIQIKHMPDHIHLTNDQETYIRGHYGKAPRSKIAAQVGLSKIDFNTACIQLGLSKEVPDGTETKSA